MFDAGWDQVREERYHTQGTDFDQDQWELYHVAEDFSESFNLASQFPEWVEAMRELWWSEAARHGALPLLDAPEPRRNTYNQHVE